MAVRESNSLEVVKGLEVSVAVSSAARAFRRRKQWTLEELVREAGACYQRGLKCLSSNEGILFIEGPFTSGKPSCVQCEKHLPKEEGPNEVRTKAAVVYWKALALKPRSTA